MEATNVGWIAFDKNLNKFQNFKHCKTSDTHQTVMLLWFVLMLTNYTHVNPSSKHDRYKHFAVTD